MNYFGKDQTLRACYKVRVDFISNFFIGGFGAFFGAACAFFFEWVKTRKGEETAQHAAIVKALLTLTTNLNSLSNLRDLIEPARHLERREQKLSFLLSVANTERVDIHSLSFLMEYADAQLILELHLANTRYQTTFDALAVRNQYLKELGETKFQAHDEHTGEVYIAIDQGAALRVKDATDALFISVDRSINELSAVAGALYDLVVPLYRGKKFPDFMMGEEGRRLAREAKQRGYRK